MKRQSRMTLNTNSTNSYLAIIPRARMGSESAHEAERRMAYWLRGYSGPRGIIVLVKSN